MIFQINFRPPAGLCCTIIVLNSPATTIVYLYSIHYTMWWCQTDSVFSSDLWTRLTLLHCQNDPGVLYTIEAFTMILFRIALWPLRISSWGMYGNSILPLIKCPSIENRNIKSVCVNTIFFTTNILILYILFQKIFL